MKTETPFSTRRVSDTPVASIPEVQMPEQTFEQFVKKERDRLAKAREDALAKRAEIDARITAVDTELAAIDAYEAAKLSKPARSTRKTGSRRSGVRQEVLAEVKNHPGGVTPAAIKEALGATDKSARQSVSNALAALKRTKHVTAKDGLYKAA